ATLPRLRSRVRTPSSAPFSCPGSAPATPRGPAAPSSSGRTADFGSVNRGSNPRGAASIHRTLVREHILRRGEVAQHGGLQNLYSPVRIRSSPPHSEHQTARWVTSGSSFGRQFGRQFD